MHPDSAVGEQTQGWILDVKVDAVPSIYQEIYAIDLRSGRRTVLFEGDVTTHLLEFQRNETDWTGAQPPTHVVGAASGLPFRPVAIEWTPGNDADAHGHCVLPAPAAGSTWIGHVIDVTGRGVPDVEVRVFPSWLGARRLDARMSAATLFRGGTTTWSATSDAEGIFRISAWQAARGSLLLASDDFALIGPEGEPRTRVDVGASVLTGHEALTVRVGQLWRCGLALASGVGDEAPVGLPWNVSKAIEVPDALRGVGWPLAVGVGVRAVPRMIEIEAFRLVVGDTARDLNGVPAAGLTVRIPGFPILTRETSWVRGMAAFPPVTLTPRSGRMVRHPRVVIDPCPEGLLGCQVPVALFDAGDPTARSVMGTWGSRISMAGTLELPGPLAAGPFMLRSPLLASPVRLDLAEGESRMETARFAPACGIRLVAQTESGEDLSLADVAVAIVRAGKGPPVPMDGISTENLKEVAFRSEPTWVVWLAGEGLDVEVGLRLPSGETGATTLHLSTGVLTECVVVCRDR